MQATAVHFGTPWQAQRLDDCLQATASAHPSGLWRVRLLLDARGNPQAQAFALPPSPARVRLQLADRPLPEAHSEFVRFKTTRRAHYDAFTPTDAAVFDTVLWNPQGEITECTRGNVAFLLDGRWVTPPLSCGLLSGVGRAQARHAAPHDRDVDPLVVAASTGRVCRSCHFARLQARGAAPAGALVCQACGWCTAA
jgi:para-aminobenzoate synthetase/4-amino-4-deoxychorismate lyase